VGLAQWNGADPPVYIGDGLIDGTELGFTRSADYNALKQALLITDSGCENAEVPCGRDAQIVLATLPNKEPPELSGAWSEDHSEQQFLTLERQPLIAPTDLRLPFESKLLPLTALGDPLGLEAIGRCP